MSGSNKSQTIKVVLFDADGVLFDVTGIHEGVVRELLETLDLDKKLDAGEVHREWDLEDEKLQRDHSTPDTYMSPIETLTQSLINLLERWGVSLYVSHIEEIATRNIDQLCTQARVFPEVEELLSILNENYVLGIISNMSTEATSRKIETTGIRNVFQYIVGPNTVQAYKPNLAIFQHTLDLYGVEPHEAVFIGDNPDTDILGGVRAGILTVLIDRRRKHHQDLNPPPDYWITSLSELPELLNSL